MSENSNHIDKLIQQKLKGHQVKAPEGAWNRLHGELHRPARTRFFWISRSAAAAVLLLIAFGAGYFFSEINRNSGQDITASNEPVIENTNDNISSAEISEPEAELLSDDENAVTTSPNTDQEISNQTKSTGTENLEAIDLNHDNLIAEAEMIENTAKSPEKFVSGIEHEAFNPKAENEETAQMIPENPVDVAGKTEETAAEEQNFVPENENVPVMSDEMLHQMLISGEDDLAQDILQNEQSNRNSKWAIGARVSPVYSYRTLSGDAFKTPDESVDASYFNDHEDGITTIAGGISLDYNFNSRLSIGSGMYLSRIGQQNNDVLAYNDPQTADMFKLVSSGGAVTVNPRKFETAIYEQPASPKDTIPGDYTVNGSFVQNLDYVEVPLVLKYKVIADRFSVNLMGGLSPGILVNNRSYFSVDGNKIQTGTTENIDPFIYNSILGLGLEYAVSGKVSLSMEPSFKYSLSPVNSTNGLDYHPYSISWFTGITYTLD